MKITSRGRYAVTAMLDVAMYSLQTNKAIPLYDIASRQDISLSYLEQIFIKLRKHKLVKSHRGPGGGYSLGVPINQISIAAILSAVEDNIDARQCKGKLNCKSGESCITHHLWTKVSDQIYMFLKNITIDELIKQTNNADKNYLAVLDNIKVKMK